MTALYDDEPARTRLTPGQVLILLMVPMLALVALGIVLVVGKNEQQKGEQRQAIDRTTREAIAKIQAFQADSPQVFAHRWSREPVPAPPAIATPTPAPVTNDLPLSSAVIEFKEIPLPQPPMPARALLPESLPDEPPAPVPGKQLRDLVLGYETRLIQGFTVLVSTQAITEGKKDNGRPFRCLATEFDGLTEVLPPRALKVLRKVRIWVEWDNMDRRNPRMLAKYYGGHIWAIDPTDHVLKSNSVTILSLKKLTEEKSYGIHRARLVLLHELSHAVHDLIVGEDDKTVAFAYKQAMERRLYDNVLTDYGGRERAYAATNRFEYFAELSCAYLDRCYYYPFTRDDLAEYDQAGYRVMQAVWGRPARREKATTSP